MTASHGSRVPAGSGGGGAGVRGTRALGAASAVPNRAGSAMNPMAVF